MNDYAGKENQEYVSNSSSSISSSSIKINRCFNNSDCPEIPKVWQGNWYDSRIVNPISGDWDEGYDLKVEWNGEIRYYKVINDKIRVVSESDVFIVKSVPWKDMSEKVRTQVVLNFFSQISEDQLRLFVYGIRKSDAKKFIEEKEIEWATEHCIHDVITTRVIAKALGYHFSTQKSLRKESGALYKEEYAIDDKWFVVLTYEPGNVEKGLEILIKDYEPIRQERKSFGAKAQQIARTNGVPWEIARILANMEDEQEVKAYVAVFKSLVAVKLSEEQKYSLISGDNRREVIEFFLSKPFCEKYLKSDSDIKNLADYILGFKR